MQYKVAMNGETVDVTFTRTASGLEAEVGGRAYAMEVSAVKRGVYVMHWGSRSIEVSVLPPANGSTVFSVLIEGRDIPVEILDGRKIMQRSVRNSEPGGVSELRSPMPGKIVRILVSEGSEVGSGQGVVVMEAMKMQNEIKASMTGRIQKIGVIEGETVGAGHLIAIVAAAARSE